MKISQLKSQIAQLEENDKAYNILFQKYRQLQNEFQLVNDSKIHLEYELKQKNETTNKILNDLKCQNVDLINELKERNSIYQKLTAIFYKIYKTGTKKMKTFVNLFPKMKI